MRKACLKNTVVAVTLVLMAALTFSGCASLLTRIQQQDSGTELVVKYAVLKLIGQSSVITAQGVLEHSALVKTLVAIDSATTVAFLIEEVRMTIPWEKLDAADQMLLDYLLAAVAAELEERLGDGLIDPDRLVTVLGFLQWVEEAAMLALASEV